MESVIPVLQEFCWYINIFGLVVIAITRISWHTKFGWAANGCLLLLFAIGNAVILSNAGLNPSQQTASLFGLVVLGSLGSRFVGNWLTDGAS